MKNWNLFLCLVLVLVISVVLVGCGSSTSSENAGKNGNGKADSQAWNDPSKPQDQTWSDPENYESQAWSDPENYDDQDWRDTENPGTEAADLDESDHAGMYRHEIDGIVFYTKHDIEQWIGHQDGLGMTFNLDQMVKDLFGDEATSSKNSASIPFNGATTLFIVDNTDTSASNSKLQAKSGFYPSIQIETLFIFDLGDGTAEYYKPFYFINGSYHCTDYEIIEILVYACEKWAKGEYYYFDDFNGSDRLLVINK